MNRRLAELEALLMSNTTQGRGSNINMSPSISMAPPLPNSFNTDRKSETSPFSLPPMRKSPPFRPTDDATEDDAPTPPGTEHSLIEVNKETHGVEYYGGSSSIAMVDQVFKRARRQSSNKKSSSSASHKPSVVNLLHNPEFHDLSPSAHQSPDGFPQAGELTSTRLVEEGFLNAFFDTLHYMHPIIDKTAFMEKCEKGATELENPFAALYFACLALGAITSPEKDPKLSGFSPIQWANMYVDRSKKGATPVPSIIR
jgi:hypothetical protein